jgi:hypothetical protein
VTASQVREGVGNELLRRLARFDADLLAPYLRPVELKFWQQLEKANRPIQAVYFPESGLASVITSSLAVGVKPRWGSSAGRV